MSNLIADWKRGTRPRLVWIDFDRYAARVFAGSPADWHRNSVRHAAAIAQAHRLIRSDVLAIDVLAPFLDAWSRRAEGAPGVTTDDAAQRAAELLQEDEPLQYLGDLADALAHSLGARADLVPKLQSPRDFLLAIGAPEDMAADFGALDECATAMVALVRKLSGKAFSCLQLVSAAGEGMSEDESDACEPLLRTAEYYGWATCLTFPAYRAEAMPPPAADLLLFPELPAARLGALGDRRYGGGLPAGFWTDGAGAPFDMPGVLHGVVPEGAHPEGVADKVHSLFTAQ